VPIAAASTEMPSPPSTHAAPAPAPISGNSRRALRTSSASVMTPQPCTSSTPHTTSPTTYSGNGTQRAPLASAAQAPISSAPAPPSRPATSRATPNRGASADTASDVVASAAADTMNASGMRSRP
jgi:hypothetical protein